MFNKIFGNQLLIKLPTLTIFLIIFNAFARANESRIVYFHDSPILDKTIIVKFKSEMRNANQASLDKYSREKDKLSKDFNFIGIESVNQKFAFSKAPNCDQCVDLRPIHELRYSKSCDLDMLLKMLNAKSYIEYAEPALIMTPHSNYNDPIQSSQYYYTKSKLYEAWEIFEGDSTITIGIVDTGFDTDHSDLIMQIAYNQNDPIDGIDNDFDGYVDNFRGWDIAMYDNDPNVDVETHGVGVSGLASARPNNGIGLIGTGGKSKFLPIKISDSYGYITCGYEGIVYAADHNCQIINCSWGSEAKYTKFGNDVVNYATYNQDALVIASAGNNSKYAAWYPAAYDVVLSVAGTVASDCKWSADNSETKAGSCWHNTVDVCAAAANFQSSGDKNTYMKCYGGTSYSAPIVSGCAALLRGYRPHLSAREVREQIKISSDYIYDIEYNQPYFDQLGTGRINAYKMLTDSTLPSIVFEDYTINSSKGTFFAGDTIYITGNFRNYLATANNITATISTDNQYIELINSSFLIRQLQHDETINNENRKFAFVINKNSPYNNEITFKLVFTGEGYRNYQYLDFTVNPSALDIKFSDIQMSLTSDGRFGYSSSTKNVSGLGIIYNNHQTISESGLIIGTSPVKVVSDIMSHRDFHQLQKVELTNDTLCDKAYHTSFDDDFATSNLLHIKIDQNVYTWENHNNFFVSENNIINNSNNQLENLYIGFFNQWEIIDARYNRISFDEKRNMSIAQSMQPSSFYVGVMVLDEMYANHYAMDYAIDNPLSTVNMFDGLNNEELFEALNSTNHQAGYSSKIGSYVADIISAGPYELMALDTIESKFAMMWAPTIDSLCATADFVKNIYSMPNDSQVDLLIEMQSIDTEIKYNKLANQLEFVFPECENIRISIFDLNGQNIAQIYSGKSIGEKQIAQMPTLNNGIYMVVINSKCGSASQFITTK